MKTHKNNWNEREKQIKAIEDNKKHLDNLDNKKQLCSNELLFSKERERFKNINNKRLGKINALSKKKWLHWLEIYC